MNEYLGCKRCPVLIAVSDEDPDGSLSDAVDHQASSHGVYDFDMASIIEVNR
jgi:hypothetical protein